MMYIFDMEILPKLASARLTCYIYIFLALSCIISYIFNLKQEQKVLKTSAPRVNFMSLKQKSKNID